MRPFVFFTFCLFVIPLNVFADAAGWSEYRSKHFVYYSDKSEKEVTKSLNDLEIFRAVMFDVLSLDANKIESPVKVYAFNSNSDFNTIANSNIGGYFADDLRGPFMAVNNRGEGMDYLFHEYIHYLVRATSSINYPTWFNEGIAEFYSTMQIKSDHVVVGDLSERRGSKYSGGKLIKLDKLMSETNQSKNRTKKYHHKFYANSWLLVHFFFLGEVNGAADYTDQLNQFLKLQNQGVELKKAFENSFTVSFQEFESQVEQYNRKRTLYARTLPRPVTNTEYVKTAVDEGEMYANFSHMAFSNGKREESTRFLEKALELKSSLALSVKALLTQREGRIEAALDLIPQALKKKPISAETLVNIGQTYKELANKIPARTDEMTRMAMYYLNRATENSFIPIAHGYLASMYWNNNEQQKAIAEITTLINKMPSNIYANLQAAEYFAKMKEYDHALYFINNVLAWSHSEFSTKQAKAMLKMINKNRANSIKRSTDVRP